MKTFDYQQVEAVLSPLMAKLDDYAHGEGNQCETIDKRLDSCAEICLEAHQSVATWAQDVFAGRVVFDPQAEQLWKTRLAHLYTHARGAWQAGRRAEVPCWSLPGQTKLDSALWHLSYLLQNWVTPGPSVAPSPRAAALIDAPTRDAIRRQLATLPSPSKPLSPRGKAK